MEENRQWRGKWIWSSGMTGTASVNKHEIVYFRRTFVVPEGTGYKLSIDISADSRYKLYCNGQSIGIGPCKGNGKTHYYETYDLSDRLQPGFNVIAVSVLHYSDKVANVGAQSIWRSPWGALYVEGSLLNAAGGIVEELHSDQRWRILEDQSVQLEAESWMSSKWLGGVERVTGSLYPHGWMDNEYEDDHWSDAARLMEPASGFGVLTPWQLTRRPIPHMEMKESYFRSISRRDHRIPIALEAEQAFYRGQSEGVLEIPDHCTYAVELDAGHLTTGFLRVKVSGGKGSRVRILPSECYEKAGTAPKRVKGIRDDASVGQILVGDSDIYVVSGQFSPGMATGEVYEPMMWRTFRFVRLEITTLDQPMSLHHFGFVEVHYPLRVTADFSSSDENFRPLWDISLRTLKNCMHESYEDCPYYEQLQYSMDTMLQCLYTYNVSADDRLAKKAIYDFHSSMLPSGMLSSRYPSNGAQVIPGFSLFWIFMLHDHYRHFGDRQHVIRYRPTIDAVLDWFDRRIESSGLTDAATVGYWSFVDWTEEWKGSNGVPADGRMAPLTVYNLMYIAALDCGAELYEATGRKDTADEYRRRAEAVRQAVRMHCWSAERNMFRDAPGVEQYSQHSQIWAVLSDVVREEEAVLLMERVLLGDLIKASFAMAFFLFRALSKVGMYDRSFALWEPWNEMVRLNLTTWMEDPVSQRSDCHGWGAVPLYEFTAEVLGVKPGKPGFEIIAVEPKIGLLKYAYGHVATAKGIVYVSWERSQNRLIVKVDAPNGIPVQLKLPDRSEKLYCGGEPIEASCVL